MPRQPQKPKALPQFASEEEELTFWETHHPADYIEGPADIVLRLKKRAPKRQITMRLDEPLYQDLKALAEEHGLPYQRLMRELLRQAVRRLRAAAG